MMIIDEQIRSAIRGDREFRTPLSTDTSFSLDENFLVRAGAGSGKTSVLIERMVALVRCGVPVDHLAAITFTRNQTRYHVLVVATKFLRILKYCVEGHMRSSHNHGP